MALSIANGKSGVVALSIANGKSGVVALSIANGKSGVVAVSIANWERVESWSYLSQTVKEWSRGPIYR